MTKDSESGLAYLRALKGPAMETRATRETPSVASATSASGDNFPGLEKRRSRRYKCEGSAEIRAESSSIRTWANFTDISLHGCYVEAQATYPVGTLLHMKLDMNGIRIEPKGIVKISYPALGMGIAFADVTPHDTAELRRLLAGLARPGMIMDARVSSSMTSAANAAVPAISNPAAAIRTLVEFFDNKQVLVREEFLRILRKSQDKK
jgi:hypothetical protein